MPLWGLARQSHKDVSIFGAGAGVHRAGGWEEMMMSRLKSMRMDKSLRLFLLPLTSVKKVVWQKRALFVVERNTHPWPRIHEH